MNSPADEPRLFRAEDKRSEDRERISSRECQTPSNFMVRKLMNEDGLPPAVAAENISDVSHKGTTNVAMSHQHSKIIQRPKPWHDVISQNLSNEFTPQYRNEPFLHAAMQSVNMKSSRRSGNNNSVKFSLQNQKRFQDSDVLKSKLDTSKTTKISRGSQVTPRSNVVTSEGITPKNPELFYESTFSRMYTKMVNKKMVLVSHPYDLPFAEKYFQEKATQLTSPFAIYSQMSSPRNLSLPSTATRKQVESRYDKIDYGSHAIVPPQETCSKSGTGASKQSPRLKSKKTVTYRPEVLRKPKKTKPLEISEQLLDYYSQLVDPDARYVDTKKEGKNLEKSLDKNLRGIRNGHTHTSFRGNSLRVNTKLQILSALDIKSSRNLERNHRNY